MQILTGTWVNVHANSASGYGTGNYTLIWEISRIF